MNYQQNLFASYFRTLGLFLGSHIFHFKADINFFQACVDCCAFSSYSGQNSRFLEFHFLFKFA